MAEPTIVCPNCKTEFPLTESLAAPMLAATRKQFELQIAQKDEDVAKREQSLRDKERQLVDTKRTLDVQIADQVAAQLKAERVHVVAEEAKKAKLASADELDAKVRELGELQEVLKSRDEKLAEAQKAQADLIKKQRELDDAKRELELENLLRAKFPVDTIEPVPKGEYGGDALQRVSSPGGQQCGTILWESKRTRNWSDGWLTKLREDQRAAKAEVAVLVSQTLPKGVESFDVLDGVWVTSPRAGAMIESCV